jgi:hypothetical protein
MFKDILRKCKRAPLSREHQPTPGLRIRTWVTQPSSTKIFPFGWCGLHDCEFRQWR